MSEIQDAIGAAEAQAAAAERDRVKPDIPRVQESGRWPQRSRMRQKHSPDLIQELRGLQQHPVRE